MELEKLLKNFQLSKEERELIISGDNIADFRNPDIQQQKKYVPESFKNIARCILNGRFEVRVGKVAVRKIYPACVEIYYHEESGKDAIKDYIVYHRNKPKKFNAKPSPLNIGSINAHQSGIDITFEHLTNINNEQVVVRASALIRGFKVEEIDSEYSVNTVDIDVTKVDGRSTYLYNALLSNLPVFDGLSIQWKDGTERTDTLEMSYRQNVKPFETYGDDSRKIEECGIVSDGRCWKFNY